MKKKVYLNESMFASLLLYIGFFLFGLVIFAKGFGWDNMAINLFIITLIYSVIAIIGFYYVPTKNVDNKEEK